MVGNSGGYYVFPLECQSIRQHLVPALQFEWFLVDFFFFKSCIHVYIRDEWFGLLMGKFRQYLTELSARDTSVF